MTRDLPPICSTLRRARRFAAGVAITGGLILTGIATDHADAAPRTKSTAIAAHAGQAVEALDRWTQTQNPADYVWFVQHRDRAATMTEHDVELVSGSLRSEWAQVDISKQHAVLNAVSQLGVPYKSLTSEPGVGFDCSGLTVWAFGGAGVDIARISSDQINESEQIEREAAEAGDLVYYPGHVSIYLGADTMVHSPNTGSHVEVTLLPSKSLRFGDAASAHRAAAVADGSLMDRALSISE